MAHLLPVFVGIDVACAKRKPLPICFATTYGDRLESLEIPGALAAMLPIGRGNAEIESGDPFTDAADGLAKMLAAVAQEGAWRIVRVAVDAPAAAPIDTPRASEAALGRCRLSSFRTPQRNEWPTIKRACRAHLRAGRPLSRLPNANKIWMLYGFEIFKALRALGTCDVLEVYPYAIVRALLPECPHKSTSEGYGHQLAAVASRTGWTPIELEKSLAHTVLGRKHDRLDAFMAAWVASLPPSGRRVIGVDDDPDDAIWVPR